MDKFLKPKFNKIKTKNIDENIGIFTLEKLEKGFGNTIGNSLRRIIISSVPGPSIFAVEIDGVQPEYQAIKECLQDAVEVIFNLKNVLISADNDDIDKEQIWEMKLTSSKGKVTAGDIKAPTGITITNPECFIAETTKDKALNMTIYVAYSKGFKTFEETRPMVDELIGAKKGIIPTDANFSPIKRVNTKIEIVNPGESVIYERLVLEVETKGNVAPEKAVAYSASVLSNYMNAFEELYEIDADEDFTEEQEEEEVYSDLTKQIVELNLSTRSENALLAAKINTVEKLVELTISDLKAVDNLGEKSIIEIIDKIKDLGLSFKSE